MASKKRNYLSPAGSTIPYPRDAVRAGAEPRVFSGEALSQISFPLGGIGTGTIGLGGRGDLRDWEIWNRPSKGRILPFTFALLWVQEEGAAPVARVAAGPPQPPYAAWMGYPRTRGEGLPHVRNASFVGEYPFAWIDFDDPSLPVDFQIEAFTPFVPMDVEASSMPVAVLRYRLTNITGRPVRAAVSFSLLNAVGLDPQHAPGDRHYGGFGQNTNEFRSEDGVAGLYMTSEKYAGDDERFGSMALVTTVPRYTYRTRWEHGTWFDELQLYWDEFAAEGLIHGSEVRTCSKEGQSDYGALAPQVELGPCETVEIPFLLAWHFPNRTNYWNQEEAVKGQQLRNAYADRFQDAWHVATETVRQLHTLEQATRRFHQSFYRETTLPGAVLDAVGANISILRSNTCLLLEGNRFYGFEGCCDGAGCCPMNCTHVWNYEQTLAHLFPQLERSMRRTDYTANLREDGSMAFRTLIPEGRAVWDFKPAADGQMGTVVKLYREWKLSGDDAFLRELWPAAKRTIEFAWKHWDPDCDGVMEGEQHNTYDIEFYGPNTMMGTCYLAALRAGEEMALALGEGDTARRYRELYEKGRARMDRELWNGEYYIQVYDESQAPKYQYGHGCLSDQMLGQYLAHVAGLGHLLPEEHVKKTMASVFRYNFRASFFDHANCQRIYALNDEAGLLLCSWPHGKRPALPFVYSDEVWTGIEYQVAAHLIYEGMLDEGLAIVKAVRDRHDGARRNPWDEFECGHHYARALASYALLSALSGFAYDARAQSLAFAPQVSAERFRTFFAAGSGWGLFSRVVTSCLYGAEIDVHHGTLSLKTLRLGGPAPAKVERVNVRAGSRDIEAAATVRDGTVELVFAAPVTIEAGGTLTVAMRMC